MKTDKSDDDNTSKGSSYVTKTKTLDENSTSKVRVNENNPDDVTIDKYTKTEDGKYTHESASFNRENGNYKSYGGGENSDDRSGNKNKK